MKKKKKGIFEEYYEYLQQIVLQKIRESRKGKESVIPELAEELLEAFTKQIQRITIRTLIFEMEICEENEMLEGGTVQERYEYFVKMFLGRPVYRKELYEAYPVLYENLLQTMEDLVHNINELLDRFIVDREELSRRLYPGNPCREIRKIGGGSSDSHRHGKRVLHLELDNGEKLVYKPRSMAVDEAYEAFLRWVFENTDMPCWWYRVWDRGEYGWCRWVSSFPCISREELSRYYYRNGVLLCVSYLLGSEDIHYENLIAHGEHPVIVDLEMAVGSRGIGIKEGMTYTERFYRESVLQTGILPLYTWNAEGEGVNVGAVNGQGGQLIPVVMPVVADPGTVKMHIEYRRPRMGEGKNLATLDGKFIEPYEFLEEILEGFEKAYSFMTRQRQETMKMLGLFQNVQVRYLVRDTQQYSMLQMTLGHPDLLVGNPDRQSVWDVLKRGMEHEKAAGWIQEQEKRELLAWDVPYFSYDVCRTELRSGTGEIWRNYFERTAMQCMENRLAHMCDADMERQKKLIRAALLIGTKKVNGKCPEIQRIQGLGRSEEIVLTDNVKNEGAIREEITRDTQAADELGHNCHDSEENRENRGITAAEKIADFLLEEAIWSEDRSEVGWISIMMAGYRERSWLIRPMNLYLYGGLAGVAVFMAELADRTKKAKYHNAAKILVNQLFRHTDDVFQQINVHNMPTGAYSGEASVALAYMLLYKVSRDQALLPYMRKQCQAVAGLLAEDREYDVLGGNAGAALVFINAYKLTGEKTYLTWAMEAGDCLLQSATVYEYGAGWVRESLGVALTGFAHGTAGIMLALARLGWETQEEKYLKAAYQAYRYEQYYFEQETLDWKDLRYDSRVIRENQGMAWCHGWGGIAMARIAAAEYVKGKFKTELKKTETFVEKKIEYTDGINKGSSGNKTALKTSLCLCHGMCGNLALLWGMGKKEKAALMQTRIIKEICDEGADIRKILELQECDNYGLFGGIAGIGYSCLCEPGKVLELLRMC